MNTNDFIEKQRVRIVKKIEQLKKELVRSQKYQDQGSTDEDKVKEFEVFEERAAISKNVEKELTNLVNALTRIDNGTYGKCKVDGGLIEQERLEVYPEAEFCASHAKDNK